MEIPLYLPTDSGHLAAVLGLPDVPNGTLLLLLTGGSRHGRVHRNRMWVKVARALDAHGVSTLRLDLPGVGDSEGNPRRFDLEESLGPPITRAVQQVVEETGTTQVLLAGSCTGARAALSAAPLIPAATDVLYVVAPTLARKPPKLKRSYKRAYLRLTRWGGLPKRVLPPPRRWDPERPQPLDKPTSSTFSRPLLEFIRRGTVLFVFGERDLFLPEIRTTLARLDTQLPPDRVELRVVPGMDLHAFREIPAQQRMIEIATGWALSRVREPAAQSPTPAS
jgi:pimeloyl-ACP methyl ester carboxylesterase